MNPFKKTKEKQKPKSAVAAVAVIRSDDPYLFEFEMYTLEDAIEEENGRISFSKQKVLGPYNLTTVCVKAYEYLARKAFVGNSNAHKDTDHG